MFRSIRTSQENKEVIGKLTSKLGLGKENVIARLALAYSITNEGKLSILDIEDSKGKEYTKHVLFGEFDKIYIALICQLYSIHHTSQEIPKYIKIHIDSGLKLLNERFKKNGLEFITNEINKQY